LAKASTTGGIIGDPRWLKTITALNNLSINNSIRAYRNANGVQLTELPLNSSIRIYSLSGMLLVNDVNTQSSYTALVNSPCLIRVVNKETVAVVKLL
jgi:hypothetical protein